MNNDGDTMNKLNDVIASIVAEFDHDLAILSAKLLRARGDLRNAESAKEETSDVLRALRNRTKIVRGQEKILIGDLQDLTCESSQVINATVQIQHLRDTLTDKHYQIKACLENEKFWKKRLAECSSVAGLLEAKARSLVDNIDDIERRKQKYIMYCSKKEEL